MFFYPLLYLSRPFRQFLHQNDTNIYFFHKKKVISYNKDFWIKVESIAKRLWLMLSIITSLSNKFLCERGMNPFPRMRRLELIYPSEVIMAAVKLTWHLFEKRDISKRYTIYHLYWLQFVDRTAVICFSGFISYVINSTAWSYFFHRLRGFVMQIG